MARNTAARELSPLAEIETSVQTRAKELGIDPGDDNGMRRLGELIDEELRRWQLDFEQGLRPFALADRDSVAERALRNIAGYGPLAPLLHDDDVYEIMINSPAEIFVKRHDGTSGYHHEVFHDDEHVTRILTKILDDAGSSHRKLDPSEGLQDAQLESGARLHIVHNDVGRNGHMVINIRKFTGVAIKTLDELVRRGMLDDAVANFLRACIRARLTTVFAGAPGSGKTTLMSCCLSELDPQLRVVIAEEVFEADVPLPNVASMQTRAARVDRKEVDLRRLVAGFLRMAPDIAIVGEVRDREVMPLLLTLSSGVKGYTTVHAGSARQTLTRLRFIAQLADTSNELPMSALNALISEAVDIVVHQVRTPDGPRVSEILAVEELQTGPDSANFTITELFRRPGPGAPLCWTGNVPVRATRALEAAGIDIHPLLQAAIAWPGSQRPRRDLVGIRP